MEFIKANAGNIIIGFIVFGALAFIVLRLFMSHRRGKSPCGCGCCDAVPYRQNCTKTAQNKRGTEKVTAS
jgi:hypothetical protein